MKARQGFTLIELLVVLSVLSVVTTMGSYAFVKVLGNWRLTTIQINLEHAAQQVFDQMEEDIGAIVPPSLSGVSVLGTARLEEKNRYRNVRLENDMMVLPIAYVHGEGQVEPASVMYRIVNREDGKIPVLERVLGAKGATIPDGARGEILQGAWAMRIEYYDGATWHGAWSNSALPRAIRVHLTLSDPVRDNEQISRYRLFEVAVQ